MRSLGCLGVLLVIGLLAVELYALLVIIHAVGDVLGPVLGVVALSVLGFKVLGHHAKKLPEAFMTGKPGGRLVGVFGGILLVLPGYITGVLGLLLQIPLLQRLFSRFGQSAAAAIAKRTLGARFPGMGGFPGMPPGGFPGMPPGLGGFPGMKPDDRRGFGPSGKTYDTTAEKD
jgi:UPF0716 protein FxsA